MKIQVNSEKNLLSDITAYINMNIIIERFTGKPFYVYTVGCLGVGRSSLGWKRVSVSFKSFQESIEVVSKHYEKGRHGSGSGFTIPGLSLLIAMGTTVDGIFVWNFEFGSLGFV